MTDAVNFFLHPADNERLINLCGSLDCHLHHIARAFGVDIHRRGEQFELIGAGAPQAASVIKKLYRAADKPMDLSDIRDFLAERPTGKAEARPPRADFSGARPPRTDFSPQYSAVRMLNESQRVYFEKIRRHIITFCAGPAGTGKTYVALAAALSLLDDRQRQFKRLVLTRPVVEAVGERLGFLPGSMEEKVNPYLRSLNDILYQFIGAAEIDRRMTQGRIEFIPLAFMRGLTLNNSVLILDEAQNTTPQQMKMLLSRLGEECKIIAMGDLEQSDIDHNEKSGIADAMERLRGLDDVARHTFVGDDIVRHPLINRILKAYEKS